MKKTLSIICLILALVLVGCSNPNSESESTNTSNSADNTKQTIEAINNALEGISLNEEYNSITAKKDKQSITIYVTTSEYVWDEVQSDVELMNSYKEDFSDIYDKAKEAADSIGLDDMPEIHMLVWEPDENSVLATGSGTSNITFLFE